MEKQGFSLHLQQHVKSAQVGASCEEPTCTHTVVAPFHCLLVYAPKFHLKKGIQEGPTSKM